VRQIAFRFATDTDIFTGIAKLRAARLMWARIAEASGADARGMAVTAMTAERMLTRRDPYVNLLRCTLACFAAALGGADAITVLPFDHALGQPDGFARRLARNTQLVLREESGLGRVLDPLGGAGLIEALTRQLAREAWSLFQTIDGGGGMAESLRRGAVQEWVAASRAAREANISRRRDAITGVSEFSDLAEAPRQMAATDPGPLVERVRQRLATAVSGAGRRFEEMIQAVGEGGAFSDPAHGSSFTAIPPHRLAEGFERLRDRSDRLLAAEGRRPRVFLCCLGRAGELAARATFAANLFASGGIEAVTSGPMASIETVASAFKASGARIAALCASDEAHGELAAAARALKAAGCRGLWLMGRPAELAAALATAGVDGFIQAGDDVLAVLDEALALLEAGP
jgi:methylmalonyl-CoA mutase